MRSVSFAGLHRILNAVADAQDGLTASQINALVLNKGLTLTPSNPRPAPTTLYHYRNTLLRRILRTRWWTYYHVSFVFKRFLRSLKLLGGYGDGQILAFSSDFRGLDNILHLRSNRKLLPRNT